jgi:hypothetical protein
MNILETAYFEKLENLEMVERFETAEGSIEVKHYSFKANLLSSKGGFVKDLDCKAVIFLNGDRVAFAGGTLGKKRIIEAEKKMRLDRFQNAIKAYQE